MLETTNNSLSADRDRTWPALPLEQWKDTYETMHRWAQIAGKIRLALTPKTNHWWNIALYVTCRGLTTSAMPVDQQRMLQLDFDFQRHLLSLETSSGEHATIPLVARPVADFYADVVKALQALDVRVDIWTKPVEVEDRTPFEQDTTHRTYDPKAAERFWRVLLQANRLLEQFRARYIGKVSPVHFFWGAFDLAVTRFSGRTAPAHDGAPNVARSVMLEAYSHEVSSAGFWPGGGPLQEAAFYAYAYPDPEGFAQWPVQPKGAYYHPELREFVLPYEAVRTAPDPDATVLAFLQSTYEAAATLANWDRRSLERAS